MRAIGRGARAQSAAGMKGTCSTTRDPMQPRALIATVHPLVVRVHPLIVSVHPLIVSVHPLIVTVHPLLAIVYTII